MAEMMISYEGELSTRCVLQEDQAEICTDAPKPMGLGRFQSPTDLVSAALGSCALTLMGIAAKKLQIDLKGTRVVVSKEMQTEPRRIRKLNLEIFCPHDFPPSAQEALIKAAETCPVHHSLHPEIIQEFHYHWGQA